MKLRKKITDPTLTKVLVASRRRCCICFGIARDGDLKRGQIAHLDGNPGNNDSDNLAFLCLSHHDEYDGTTSQSKGLIISEVKAYREELYAHFGSWSASKSRDHLLNFLASTIGIKEMAAAAIKVGNESILNGAYYACQALTTPKIDFCDMMLYIPYLQILDSFESWGWLTYETEEKEDDYGDLRVYISVVHEPICAEVAEEITRLKQQREI